MFATKCTDAPRGWHRGTYLINYSMSERCIHAQREQLLKTNSFLPNIRSNLSRQNFFYVGPGWWNALDPAIKQLGTYAGFKRHVGKMEHNDINVDI